MIRFRLLAVLALCWAASATASSIVDCPATSPRDFPDGYLDISPRVWSEGLIADYFQRFTLTVGKKSYEPKSVDIRMHGNEIDITLTAEAIAGSPLPPKCIASAFEALPAGMYVVTLRLNSPQGPVELNSPNLLVLGLPPGHNDYACTLPNPSGITFTTSPAAPDSTQALNAVVGIFDFVTYGAQINRVANTIDITVSGWRNDFSVAIPSSCTSLPLGALPSGVYTLNLSEADDFMQHGNHPETKRFVTSKTIEVSGPPAALSGLWWNPGESGWGINFTQRGSNVFAVWYTYDAAGNPKWYVAPHCELSSAAASGHCVETLYEVNGPRFFGSPFNPAAAHISGVGTMSLTFTDETSGSMTYTVAGQTRTVAIARQPLPSGSTPPPVNYTDLWWNPDESGWGMAVTHQYGVMFLAWFVYDSAGKPIWYVASNCNVKATGDGCDGILYRASGPAFGPTFDSSQVQATAVGTVNLTFPDSNNASLSYTVDGMSSTKTIKRQVF